MSQTNLEIAFCIKLSINLVGLLEWVISGGKEFVSNPNFCLFFLFAIVAIFSFSEISIIGNLVLVIIIMTRTPGY